MFEKYQPIDTPAKNEPDSLRSRGKIDPRLPADEPVVGVFGPAVRAYRTSDVAKAGLVTEEVGWEKIVVLWEPLTRTAAAYRLVASPPRKFKGPQPDHTGVSPPDESVVATESRRLTFRLASGHFVDAESNSSWDVAGRCVAGQLKGWTLEWIDSVQVKWFAWAAEHPETSIHHRW